MGSIASQSTRGFIRLSELDAEQGDIEGGRKLEYQKMGKRAGDRTASKNFTLS